MRGVQLAGINNTVLDSVHGLQAAGFRQYGDGKHAAVFSWEVFLMLPGGMYMAYSCIGLCQCKLHERAWFAGFSRILMWR